MMGEYNSNADYLKSFPPRLEDAGLEDTVLSADGIQEAFHRAAEMVRSAASSIVGGDSKDAGCVGNSGPTNGDWTDVVDSPVLYGERPKSCVDTNTGGLIEESHDLVLQGGGETKEDQLVQGHEAGSKLGEGGCVEGEREAGELPGFGGIAPSNGDKKDGDGPILTGAYL